MSANVIIRPVLPWDNNIALVLWQKASFTMKTKEINAYGKKVRSIGFHSVVRWQKGINFLSFDSLKDAFCQCTAAMLLSQGITGRIIGVRF